MEQIPKITKSEFQEFTERCKYLYHIRTKDNRLVTYQPNTAQKYLNQVRKEEFERSKKIKGVEQCKIILLKSRQIGGTTDTAMYNLDLMLNLNMAYGLILAHDGETTPIIYEKYRLAYHNLPKAVQIIKDNGDEITDSKGNPLVVPIKPDTEAFSGYQLKFSNQTQSRVLVRTAGGGSSVARGDTTNFFHGCLHKDSLVILSNGFSKRIEDVKKGDKIITHNGNIAPVKEKIYTGRKQTYEINTWLTNQTISVTKDHKILTDKGWKETKNITKKDYIQLPNIELTNEIKEYKFELKTKKRDQGGGTKLNYEEATIKLDKTFGYLLGYYLSEGHVKKSRLQTSFTCHKDEEYFDNIQELCEEYSTSIRVKTFEDSLRKKIICQGKFFTSLIEDICGRTEDKHIPDWFFNTNKDFIEGVLSGYFSGDGSKTTDIVKTSYKGKEYNHKTNRVRATSVNESISRQIKRLILALDIGVPSLSYKEKVYRYNKRVKSTYKISCNGIVGEYIRKLINNEIEVKGNPQRKAKKINGKWFVKVQEIVEDEKTEVYDLEIDHEDHSYQTPVGIVSNSEIGYWKHFNEVMTAVNQTIPNSAKVYSVLESTANGVSGTGEGFYRMWKKSKKEWKKFKNGETNSFEGYRPVFVPWYKMKEYRKPLLDGQLINVDNVDWHSPERKQEYLQMEEKLVEEIFDDRQEGLEAINWYRWCIKENCQYDINEAMREYPTTDDQAFVSTDNCFFDTPKLFVVKHNFEEKGEESHQIGYISDNYEFKEEDYGELKIWEHPRKNYVNRYIVSIDPAEGRDEGDFSCIMVFDRLQEKFVAKWYGSLKEDLVAEELLKIAYYYNKALIIPERNLSTIITLIEPYGVMPYTGDLYHQTLSSGRVEYGYYTSNNRKDLLMEYNSWLRTNYDKIPDTQILDEHMTFTKHVNRGRPKYEASEGNHDDTVLSCALAIHAHFWWEEEIYKTDEEETDIEQIFQKPKRKNSINISKLGRRKKRGRSGSSIKKFSNNYK